MTTELIGLLMQTGFAGLFLYLFVETRKDSREDKKLALDREEKLHTLVNTLMGNYASVSTNVQHIARFMADANSNSQKMTSVLDSLLSVSRRTQFEIGQIQGQLGIDQRKVSTKEIENPTGGKND